MKKETVNSPAIYKFESRRKRWGVISLVIPHGTEFTFSFPSNFKFHWSKWLGFPVCNHKFFADLTFYTNNIKAPPPIWTVGYWIQSFFWAEPCSFSDPSLPTRDQTQAQGNESAKFQSLDTMELRHQSYFYMLSFFSFYKEYNLLYSKFGKQMSSSLSPILIQGQQITFAYTYRLGYQGSWGEQLPRASWFISSILWKLALLLVFVFWSHK